jgi:hypothetical protein
MIGKFAFRALIVAALLSASGCASDAIRLSAAHSPLVRSSLQREGRIILHPLEDARLTQMRRFVGSSGYERAGSPPAWNRGILLEGDQKLGPLLTGYVADALQHAGYQPVIQSAPSGASDRVDPLGAILEGKIEVFWLNRGDFAIWHHVELSLSLVEESTGKTRWHRAFESRKTRPWLWDFVFVSPDRADCEPVIREALDKALSDMVDAFASIEFYTHVRESGTSAR